MANVYIKSDKTTKKFIVIEQAYEIPLKDFDTYDNAKKFAKIQNNGGGFNGHTPLFVLKSARNEKKST